MNQFDTRRARSHRNPMRLAVSIGMGAVALAMVPAGGAGAAEASAQPGTPVGSAGNRSIAISWVAPTDGMPVADYTVQFSNNGGRSWKTFADGVSPATSTTVTGLRNGVAYSFRVATAGAAGRGPWSARSAAVAPLAPQRAPLQLVASPEFRGAKLSWRAPAAAGRASVIDYVVQFSIDGGTTWAVYDDGVSTATTTRVRNLLAGARYRFRVAALTTSGLGAFSDRSGVITPTMS